MGPTVGAIQRGGIPARLSGDDTEYPILACRQKCFSTIARLLSVGQGSLRATLRVEQSAHVAAYPVDGHVIAFVVAPATAGCVLWKGKERRTSGNGIDSAGGA